MGVNLNPTKRLSLVSLLSLVRLLSWPSLLFLVNPLHKQASLPSTLSNIITHLHLQVSYRVINRVSLKSLPSCSHHSLHFRAS